MAKKVALEEERANQAAAAAEAAEAASWEEGARKDKKGAAEKEAERLRKAAEKAALLAEDDAALSEVTVKKSKKKKGKDDFADLTAALAAAPKTAAQKAAERKAAEDAKKKAENLKKAEEAKEAKALKEAEEAKKQKAWAAKGMVANHTDDLLMHSKSHNKLDDEDTLEVTGLDDAIEALSMDEKHPRMKQIYKAYADAQLPLLREEYPGLKLSQYKQKIYDNFQKAPENPNNQAAAKANVFKMGAEV
tara:strand:- start:91 stop:834 length:744 start_codon:yes stop_codon:yes gene_type:complete